jgi:hypothetical protein
MKLTGIDAAKSKEGEIVFRTEPPMTKEVLQELPIVWILGNDFDIDGELLVWRGGAYPEKSLRQQTDIYLTEAEDAAKAKKPGKSEAAKAKKPGKSEAVKAKKPGANNQHQTFLEKVSEQTGLPLV